MDRVPSLCVVPLTLLAAFVLAAGFSRPAAAAEGQSGRLADHLPGYSVARCAFPQGKLVLEHGDELHVLRQGDTVPGLPRVRVHEISDRRAVLFEAAIGANSGSAVPHRMLKIDEAPDGTTRVTLLGADLTRTEEVELLGDGSQWLSVTPTGPVPPTDDGPDGDGPDGGEPDGGEPDGGEADGAKGAGEGL